MVPVFDNNGAVRINWRHDASRHKVAEWCPLEYDNTPAEVARMRAIYAARHRALVDLVYCLRDAPSLGHIVATGPAALGEPWHKT